MSNSVPFVNLAERRWNTGSYVAAGFALIFFIYQLGMAIFSTTRPTDGWLISGKLQTSSPEVSFVSNFLDEPSPIQASDLLLAVNDLSVQQLLDARAHLFPYDPS